MKRSIALLVVALAGLLGGTAEAKSLRDTLAPNNAVLQGAIAPLGKAIGSQVANQIPSLSTSAGYTYEWNPELEVLERSAKTFGPLFTERAVTLGRNKFNLNLSYTFISFQEFNGKNLDRLTNRVERAFVPEAGNVQYFGLARSFTASDGIERAVGDQVRLDLDLEAQLWDLSFTYGVLDSLDVNIDIPVLRTYARSGVQETLPDPRCLGLLEGCDIHLDERGTISLPVQRQRESSVGIGDIHLRAKWAPGIRPIRLAGLLDLALPTGDAADFQGTGDTRLATILIGSTDLGSMFEVHGQGGIDFNVNDVDLSQARYAIGVTAQLISFFALTVDFIGRSEFAAMARIPNTGRLPAVRDIDGVPTLTQPLSELAQGDAFFKGRPLFVDIKRNDILDLAIGGRVALGDRIMLLGNVLVPLNDDGLRADWIPTVALEANF
jgi:hypothetical protein